MEKPSKEHVEELLNDFEFHGVIGPRQDVFSDVVGVLRAYLALMEDAEQWRQLKASEQLSGSSFIKLWSNYCDGKMRIEELEVENQALKAQLHRSEA